MLTLKSVHGILKYSHNMYLKYYAVNYSKQTLVLSVTG